jgi:hypothetical protein
MENGTPTIHTPRRLVRYSTYSLYSTYSIQCSRVTEYSADHMTHRSAVSAAGRNECRCLLTPLRWASLHLTKSNRSMSNPIMGEVVFLKTSSTLKLKHQVTRRSALSDYES